MSDLLLIGTYTTKGSKGIYGIDLDAGHLSAPRLMATVDSPSYIITDHQSKLTYAVTEDLSGKSGRISCFSYDTNTLHLLNEVEAPSKGLVHVTVDKARQFLFTVSYRDAQVFCYRLKEDGRIGDLCSRHQHIGSSVVTGRQESAHAHSIWLTPDEARVFVCDLGMDEIVVYDFNKENGQLSKADNIKLHFKAGFGPRHLVFNEEYKQVYVLGELSKEIGVFSYQRLTSSNSIDYIKIPETGNTDSIGAAIRLSKDERFLYVSVRGDDTISVFELESDKSLKLIQQTDCYGNYPRDFNLIYEDKYLVCANRFSDSLTLFRRDSETGTLIFIKKVTGISEPICICEFLPEGEKK